MKVGRGLGSNQCREPWPDRLEANRVYVRDVIRDHAEGLALREKTSHTGPHCTKNTHLKLPLSRSSYIFHCCQSGRKSLLGFLLENRVAVFELNARHRAEHRLVMRDPVLGRVLRRDGEGVRAIGLLDTLVVHAVPLERVDAGRGRKVAGVHDLAGFVTNIKTRCQRILRQEVGGLGDAVLELRLIAIRLDHLSDILNGAERHRVLLQRHQAFEVLVLLHLLFDAGEQNQLISELVRIERRQRILELELRRQDGKEVVQIIGQIRQCLARRARDGAGIG